MRRGTAFGHPVFLKKKIASQNPYLFYQLQIFISFMEIIHFLVLDSSKTVLLQELNPLSNTLGEEVVPITRINRATLGEEVVRQVEYLLSLLVEVFQCFPRP